MKLPPKSRFDWRHGVRRARSLLGAVGAVFVRFKVHLAVLSLATLAGFAVVLSGPDRGLEFKLSTALPLLGALGATIVVAAAVIRRLDEVTRNHVGGAWVTDLSILAADTPGFTNHRHDSKDATGLRMLAQLAERTFAGTMAAGVGRTEAEREQNRKAAWAKRLEANPDCLAYALDSDETLAALTLVYPLADATYEEYRHGALDYIKLTREQTTANAAASGSLASQQLYVSVCLGDARCIQRARREERDLVGRLLVQHIGTIMERIRADPTRTRILADGLTGKNLESFRRKGFTVLPAKDRNEFHLVELRPTNAGVAPAEFVDIAFKSPRL